MNINQISQEKHRMDIAQQVEIGRQHTPYYGYIRLRQGHTCIDISENSIPGLVKSIILNETVIHAVVEDGNINIGENSYDILIDDIEVIEVEEDINRKKIV